MLKHLFSAALVAAVLVSSAHAQSPKVRVLIIDGQNNHDWRHTTPLMKKELESCGRFLVDVATAPPRDIPDYRQAMEKFHPDLSKYDVILSNYNGDNWGKAFSKDFDDAVKSGKIGLVIVHAANNSFPGWKDYNLMIGMGWRGANFGDCLTLDKNGKELRIPKGKGLGTSHRYVGEFEVVIRDPDHPITKGMPREWKHARDELYDNLRGPIENVRLLATAYSPGTKEHEPMIFTITYGKGRVFHTPMGHDTNAMRCVGFITTLQRGTEWAATGAVTIPIPPNFPTASKSSSIPAK
jgi:type 1 glutamine amidotransferase